MNEYRIIVRTDVCHLVGVSEGSLANIVRVRRKTIEFLQGPLSLPAGRQVGSFFGQAKNEEMCILRNWKATIHLEI